MKCSICGAATVSWRGPWHQLTHTECSTCGARNCEVPEEDALASMGVSEAEVLAFLGGGDAAAEEAACAVADVSPEEAEAYARILAAIPMPAKP